MGLSVSSFEVEQSFRNLVMFYSRELRQIDEGCSATVFFNDLQRKKLTKIGVLRREYLHRGCRLRLTEKTRQLLSMIYANATGQTISFLP